MSNTATFNTSPNLKLSKKLSFGEEVANSVTHAVGAMAMLVLLPITAVHANNGYGMTAAVGMSVFVRHSHLFFLQYGQMSVSKFRYKKALQRYTVRLCFSS